MADAISIAYAYVNRRERTVAEVRARLEKAQCEEPEIDAAVAELREFGFLDDARYARLFVEDRRNLDGWGRERIVRSLTERGVDRDVVSAELEQAAGGESEVDRAVELLTRRYPVRSEDPRESQRAFAMLVRKGYGSETAGDAVRAWSRGGRD